MGGREWGGWRDTQCSTAPRVQRLWQTGCVSRVWRLKNAMASITHHPEASPGIPLTCLGPECLWGYTALYIEGDFPTRSRGHTASKFSQHGTMATSLSSCDDGFACSNEIWTSGLEEGSRKPSQGALSQPERKRVLLIATIFLLVPPILH